MIPTYIPQCGYIVSCFPSLKFNAVSSPHLNSPPSLNLPSSSHAACEACTKSIEKSRGKLVVKEAARAVSERDDRLLAEKMEALENANKEVSCGRGKGKGALENANKEVGYRGRCACSPGSRTFFAVS